MAKQRLFTQERTLTFSFSAESAAATPSPTSSTPPSRAPVRRPTKIAHLLAWAHKAQRQIDNGEFKSRSHLARYLGVTHRRGH